MAPLVVLAVADSGESLVTVSAFVRFLTGVSSDMYLEVTFFGKYLSAAWEFAIKKMLSGMCRLDMEFKTGCSGKGLCAVRVLTYVSVNFLVTSDVVLQVLFELEGLSALWIVALKISVG